MGWVLRICFNLEARKLKEENRHGALAVVELLRAENSKKGVQGRIYTVRKQRRCFKEKEAAAVIIILE